MLDGTVWRLFVLKLLTLLTLPAGMENIPMCVFPHPRISVISISKGCCNIKILHLVSLSLAILALLTLRLCD